MCGWVKAHKTSSHRDCVPLPEQSPWALIRIKQAAQAHTAWQVLLFFFPPSSMRPISDRHAPTALKTTRLHGVRHPCMLENTRPECTVFPCKYNG